MNIFNLSFGKDSMATLILAAEQGIPIDRVLYVDIKFNDEISGEHPIMAEWIPTAEKRLKELFGITVDHAYSGIGYEAQFWKRYKRGTMQNMYYGFPHLLSPWCNSRLKVEAINKYFREVVGGGGTTRNSLVLPPMNLSVGQGWKPNRRRRKNTALCSSSKTLPNKTQWRFARNTICYLRCTVLTVSFAAAVGFARNNVWRTCGAFGRTTPTFTTACLKWSRTATTLSNRAA